MQRRCLMMNIGTVSSSARSAIIYRSALRDVAEELTIQFCQLIPNSVQGKFRQIQNSMFHNLITYVNVSLPIVSGFVYHLPTYRVSG
jgi:hypothetical protein